MKIHKRERFYTLSDVAAMLDMLPSSVWRRVWVAKTLPQPTVRIGRTDYYTETEFNRIVGQ